jgi:formate hydrogenlyase subunit 3/multisubunit Na+/H+ antiporter MnhD subunit
MLYLLLIFFPIAIAAATFVLRKASGLVIFAALGAVLVQILIAVQIPLDDPTRLLGVTLTLNALNRTFMLLFLGVGGFLIVAAYHLPHGENFVPITLLTLAQICGVLLLQDPFITALLLVATGLTAVLAIVDLPAGTSQLVGTRAIAAALKYLVLTVVAGTLMYIAFVLTDFFSPGERPNQISPARFILALLAVSFAVRMALVPFHTWLMDLVDHGALLVAGLVAALLNTTSLLVLILTFQSYPSLLIEGEGALTVMRIGAATSVALASILMLGQASLRQTISYLLFVDCGMVFYGLASFSTLGLTGAILASLSQVLAIALIFISLGLLERPDGRTPSLVRRDLLRRWPVAGAGLIVGVLTLLGLPPFSGAMGRLLIYQAAAAQGQGELLVLIGATVLAGLGVARAAYQYLLGPSDEAPAVEPLLLGETELDRPAPRRLEPEPASTAVLTMLLLGACLAVGLYPGPLLATIAEALRSLTFLRAL